MNNKQEHVESAPVNEQLLAAAPAVKAEQVQCSTCNDTALIGDLPIECPDCRHDAAPSLPAAGSAVEEVEVRGLQWLDTGHYRKKPPQFGYNPHDWNPLMTVAQHQRILAASVPAGCKAVPVEATKDMEEAGCQAYMNADAAAWIMHRSSMGAAYKAMVAAANGGKLIPLELLMRVCAQPFDIEECMTIDRASALEELRALLASAEGVKDE